MLRHEGSPQGTSRGKVNLNEPLLLISAIRNVAWKWLGNNRKQAFSNDDCGTSLERTVFYEGTELLPLHLVLVHLWRMQALSYSDGKRFPKLKMQMEVPVFIACQNSSWL